MYKGQFRTDTFDLDQTTVNMCNWVEPTLYNTGETIVYVNGITISPGDSFILGPAGVEMNGTIPLIFQENQSKKSEVKINYVLLVKEEC